MAGETGRFYTIFYVLRGSCNERFEEFAENRRPLGVLGAARRMAEIAVDLEIARLYPGRLRRVDHGGRDLRREQRVAAAQDVEHLGPDAGEIGPRVPAEQCA